MHITATPCPQAPSPTGSGGCLPPVSDKAACILETLRGADVFGEWAEADRQLLAPQARLRRHGRGSPVLTHGSVEVVVVASGCVELSCVNALGTKFVRNLLRRCPRK